jgi:hypothetical protein
LRRRAAFVRAGQELGLAHPTISGQIHRLEHVLARPTARLEVAGGLADHVGIRQDEDAVSERRPCEWWLNAYLVNIEPVAEWATED